MEVKETIDDILKTKTEDLRADQVEFMEQVLDIYEQSRRKPWCLWGSIFAFSVTFAATLSLLSLPFSALIGLAYIGGAAASIGFAQAIRKSSQLADYSKIGTNKFSFEDFEMNRGIELVENKLEEYYNYEAEQIMQDIVDFGKPEPVVKTKTEVNTDEKSHTVDDLEK